MIESIPYPSRRGIETILAELAASDPKARQAQPEDFVDQRFVAELEFLFEPSASNVLAPPGMYQAQMRGFNTSQTSPPSGCGN